MLVRAVLTAHGGVRLAILFGSLAAGKGRPDSDVDLTIDAGHVLKVETKMTLIGKLAEATGRPIDLIDLRSVGEPLLGQIIKHGKRLFGEDAIYAELIKRHLFDEAGFRAVLPSNTRRKEKCVDREVVEQNWNSPALPSANQREVPPFGWTFWRGI